jgi:hypothetical protein
MRSGVVLPTMAFRRFLRGQVPSERLESVAAEVVRRYGDDEDALDLERLDADNWLSEPCVVNERWFVKVITDQHTLVHALLTAGRNVGAFSAGAEGFFERFDTPVEMAEHELMATRRMRELGVNAPEPVEAFAHDDLGVLVLEYLPEYRVLDELDADETRPAAEAVFDALASMHDAGLAHGDLRTENVLVREGEVYFIDATSVREDAIADARAYDLACALAALSPVVGAGDAVEAARSAYDDDDLLAAREFLDFVNMRPDHGFDAALVKGEIEKAAS